MNVLITNSQEVQAYIILRSLRPVAKRVVITEGGDSVGSTGFRGLAYYSRFVDARYTVPNFSRDWLAGRTDLANTHAEEAYILRIEEICRLEDIDVVFPSLDPEVWLFAKNKDRLARRGVLAIVPEVVVVQVAMDKALTVRAAEKVGCPIPKTWFPELATDLREILAESSPPWIVKPRYTAHGANMVYVKTREELESAYTRVSALQSRPIVQEFVRDGDIRSYQITVDGCGRILTLLSYEGLRYSRAGFKVSIKSALSRPSGPSFDHVRALVQELGLRGWYTIQFLSDPRDGIPKLLEINVRPGHLLWWVAALGVNEPLIMIQIARGEPVSGNLSFPEGVLLLDPFHDVFFLYAQIIEALFQFGRWLMRRPGSTARHPLDFPAPGIRATLRAYAHDYLNFRRKVLCPEASSVLTDPYPCVRAFAFKFSGMTGSFIRQAARAWDRIFKRV